MVVLANMWIINLIAFDWILWGIMDIFEKLKESTQEYLNQY